MTALIRTYDRCGGPIPVSARSHAMFCSGKCKVAAFRAARSQHGILKIPRVESKKVKPDVYWNKGDRWVYVISAGPERVKVGIAANPGQRLADLQIGSPVVLSLAYSITVDGDAHAVERLAHKALSEYRLHGEWFGIAAPDAMGAVMKAASHFDLKIARMFHESGEVEIVNHGYWRRQMDEQLSIGRPSRRLRWEASHRLTVPPPKKGVKE